MSLSLSFASSSTNNIEVKLNDDLVRVNEWLIANKLTLNSSKTEFMLHDWVKAKAKYVSITVPSP